MQNLIPPLASHCEYIACPMCDVLHKKVVLERKTYARCTHCGAALYGAKGLLDKYLRGGGQWAVWLALTLSAWMLFIMANVCALAQCTWQGQLTQITLWGALHQLWESDNPWLLGMSACVTFTIVIVPALQGLALLWLLLPLRFIRLKARSFFSISSMRCAVHMLRHLQPWSMADVLFLSALVTFIKFSEIAPIETGAALPALSALAILQALLGLVGLPHMLRVLASKQRVCAPSHPHGVATPGPTFRRLQYVWALWLSALLLYVPSMLLPMMHTRSFLSSRGSTLLEGIVHFWTTGSWVLALLIVVASVCIPLFKLVVLGLLLWQVQCGICHRPQQSIWLYHAIAVLGRWSMLDLLVLMLTVALMHFYAFATVSADVGAVAFAAVVIFTLCATHVFDVRWIPGSKAYHAEQLFLFAD